MRKAALLIYWFSREVVCEVTHSGVIVDTSSDTNGSIIMSAVFASAFHHSQSHLKNDPPGEPPGGGTLRRVSSRARRPSTLVSEEGFCRPVGALSLVAIVSGGLRTPATHCRPFGPQERPQKQSLKSRESLASL